MFSGVASSISEGAIFIYSCSGQLSSFEIDLISKELNCPEHEYMNMAPSLIELATPLLMFSWFRYQCVTWMIKVIINYSKFSSSHYFPSPPKRAKNLVEDRWCPDSYFGCFPIQQPDSPEVHPILEHHILTMV